MAKAETRIIGIEYEVEDDRTGAVAAFHVLEYVQIDYKYGRVSATVNGYASRRAYEADKVPLKSYSASYAGLPENAGDLREWCYRKLVEADNADSIFAGQPLAEAPAADGSAAQAA
ncbi:hypothetical protein V9W64_10935 [Neisseria leonii]|uniref:Phage associated protein n=1 Tax=Neisseria leonii TaxID=2995413 RepID=A0A9X4ID27_9NEIS|nr:hypothetical protein [Neisseria sp. 51.81]MDD9326757.1 hypothetical protein [Neisseria sp. 51.81]